MQLGLGHLALLLASGSLDGLIEPPDEPPHVIRGTVRKVEYVKSQTSDLDDNNREVVKTVLAEKIVLTVRAVDASGTIHQFSEE